MGTLGAGEETDFTIVPKLVSGLSCCTSLSASWSVPARAVITNTVPEEEERFKGNNTAVGWIYVNQNGDTEAAVGRYWLEASVDDLLADAGDTVKFKFTINSPTLVAKFVHDAKVRLRLDEGMRTPTATTTMPATATFGAADGTWDWDLTSTFTGGAAFELSTTLADPLPAGDLCLTADLTARPGNNLGSPDFVSYTSAEICLREDPAVLLQEGQATLFNMYPCVGVTAYPCSSTDNLIMRVVGGSAARAAGIARDEAVLDPARVFVQVKDPEGRRIDAHGDSVNSGTAPSWHTARKAHSNIASAVGGVQVSYTRKEFTSTERAKYTQLDRTVAVAGLDGASAPGLVNLRFPTTGNDEFIPRPSQTKTNSPFPSVSTTIFDRFVEFETLGTYKVDFTAAATHTDSTVYSDTGSYIFHVGPVAELGVSDGDAGLAPSGTRAFTIVTVNNGPDDAPDVEVEVTGLNAGDYVSHSATAGDFNSTTGVWTSGEMSEPRYQQDIYGRDEEVLTIITSTAVDTEITASISNDEDYEVCIDSSGGDVVLSSPSETACTTEDSTNTWHTAKYYDYISDNDSATIKAKDGTGADLPSLQSPQAKTAAIVVSWDAVADVNGRKVTHYEVQRETNPWVTVADDVAGTTYIDTDIQAGDTHRYRVRAFNDRDQKGPWSAPIEGSVEIAPPGRPSGMGAEILVFWNAPAGAVVDHYELQVSDDGGNNWVPLNDSLVDNSYRHTGLQEGDTRHYRVRAWNTDDPQEEGPWSATVSATTDVNVPTPTQTQTPTPTPEPAPEPRRSDPEPSNSSPRFTEGGSTTRHVQENSEPGTDVGSPVSAEDRNRDRLTYELGGADAASFEIVASSGQIRTKAELDYETKARYRVSVSVSDGKNSRGEANDSVDDVIDVAISITNQGERGAISLSEALPVVGTAITAELTDPDGGVSGVSWAWERSADGDAWSEIPEATSATYTPADGDSGHYLRVTASYTDAHGPSKSATSASSVPVAALGIAERYDSDGDGSISLGEALQAASDYRNGIITYDEAIAVTNLYLESQAT